MIIKNSDIYKIKIYKNEWLRFKLEHPGSRKKIIAAVWILFGIMPYVIYYFTNLVDNSLYLEGEARGFFEDPAFNSYIFIPLLFHAALNYFPQLSDTLLSLKNILFFNNNGEKSSLKNNKGTSIQLKIFNELLHKYEFIILGKEKSNILKYVLFCGGLVWSVMLASAHYYAADAYGFDIYFSQKHLVTFVVRAIYETIVFGFLFPFILFKFLTILYTIKHICIDLTKKEIIRLRPINPDKAGGLGDLGKYSLKLVILLLPPLLPIFAYMIFNPVTIVLLAGLTLYLPLLVFTFFYPLSGAHKAMKEFKDRELQNLSNKFNTIYDTFIEKIDPDVDTPIPEEYEALEKIDRLYKKAEKMPVWPFDTDTITKFGSILAAIFTSIWLNWLFGKLVQM